MERGGANSLSSFPFILGSSVKSTNGSIFSLHINMQNCQVKNNLFKQKSQV